MSFGCRLPLLCRKTRALSADVHRLVREYLRMRVGKHCPWIDELLWRHYREEGLVIELSRTVAPGICPKGETDFGGSSETETAAGVLVTLRLEVQVPRCCHWTLTIDERYIGGSSASITTILAQIRSQFDARRAGPGASMEVPASAKEWRALVDLWLFGPPEPKQASLQKWLRPRA